jgi:hypothetical protein
MTRGRRNAGEGAAACECVPQLNRRSRAAGHSTAMERG